MKMCIRFIYETVHFRLTTIWKYIVPIVGKGGHTPPSFLEQTPTFLRFPPPPFLEIQDVHTFHRSIWKTKVLNNS